MLYARNASIYLLLFVITSGCISTLSPQIEQSENKYISYESLKYKFNISIPGEWYSYEFYSGPITAFISPPGVNSSVNSKTWQNILAIAVQNYTDFEDRFGSYSNSLKGISNAVIEEQQNRSDFEMIDNSEYTISKKPARKIVYTLREYEGAPIQKYIQIITIHNSTIYRLVFYGPIETYHKYEPIIEKMESSFEIV